MPSHSQVTLSRAKPAGDCRSRISRLTGVLQVILFLGLLYHSNRAFSLTLPSSYLVTLAWEHSPSPEVVGYRVYYGAASGDYTNSIVVGDMTTIAVSGLAGGVTYYFAVTAYDANNVESSFSNEITFVPGLPGIKPVQALIVALASPHRVTLAWEHSPSSEVVGYRIYYGAASGDYTNSIVVGDMTTIAVSGLAGGVTYYFAVTAYDANDVESSFSNEITFVPGLPGIQIVASATGEVVLTLKGLIAHTYEVEATEDFKNWTVIATLTLGADGSLEFTDKSAASFPRRFYRTRALNP